MSNVDAVGVPFLYLLFGFYLAAAVTSFLARTWLRPVALIGAAAALLLAAWIWALNLSLPIWVLPTGGTVDLAAPLVLSAYSFQLQPDNAPVLAICLVIGALALLLNALYRQDSHFPALAWLTISGYSLIVLLSNAPVSTVIVAPVLLVMLTALSVFALHGRRNSDVTGPLRWLIPPVLATPLFLLAGWWIEQIPLNPQETAITQAAGTLLGLGILCLLAPFPLHGAMPASSESAPPPAMLFVSLIYQLAVLHLAAQVLATFPFTLQQSDWPLWMSALGLLTAVWGGSAAVGANHAGRLWGYAALHDWGIIVLALATPDVRSWTLALFLFALRAISMFTAAAGLSAIEERIGSLHFHHLQGVGLRMPWNSTAFLLGGLGLVGFPLTAGFAGHWAALQSLATVDWRPAAVIVVASAGIVLGYVRVARLMFGSLENRAIAREGAWSIVMAVSALAVTVVVATSPQILSALINSALAAFD